MNEMKEARIFFISGEGGRICKREGITKNEAGDFNFRFRPVNSFFTKEVNGIPSFLVMHVSRASGTDKSPAEGCYVVFTDSSGSKIKTREFLDYFTRQLETLNAKASLAEGQAAKLGGELKKFKTQTQRAVEDDVEFVKGMQKRGRPRPEFPEGLGMRRIKTIPSLDEYEEFEGEE